jgi:mono/diheme cytochrome c family protein
VPKLSTLIPTRLLASVLAPAVIRSRAAVPLVVWLAAVVWLGGQSATRGEEAHAVAQNLILSRCVECHGVDAQESNLRLDSRAAILKGGDFGPAAVAGKADTSELVRRVKTTNPEQMMPPDGERLPAEEVAALAAWIDAGLPWPGREAEPEGESVRDPRLDHWAWQPIVKPAVPAAVAEFAMRPGVERERNQIDFFIRAKLAEKQLAPSPVADRATLIRRLSFDLTGLPPTSEEIEAFVADTDPQAYETLVDRLLASPRYGERWARHWLDVVHYGDTHGYDKDKPRPNAWPYRDYVVRSLNADKPYARFIEEQVAGDVLYPDTLDGQQAIGFIAAGPWDLIGHTEVPETKTDGKIARHLDRDDMVANTIGTFAGVTIHCAQCHAHKFDPITQDDYYSLQAVFAALDREDRPYHADPAVRAAHASVAGRKAAVEKRQKDLEAAITKAAGPRLAELDKAIAAKPAAKGGNPGDEFGYHSAISSSPDAVKWLQLDLGRETALTEIVLCPCYDDFNGIGAGFGFPLRYRMEVSNDPAFATGVTVVSAQDAADVPSPGTVPQRVATTATARYVRITATKLAPRNNDFIFALAEVRVTAADGKDVAAGSVVTSLDSIEAPPRWQRRNVVDGQSPHAAADELAALKAERNELLATTRDEKIEADLTEVKAELEAIEAERKQLPVMQTVYAATARQRGGTPRTIHVLSRGNVLSPAHEVGPGALALVDALQSRFDLPPSHAEGDRRAALAHWLADPRNPLTWRNIVNRVWHYHFGQGIVATPSDFGRMGAPPTHPELLDWLAVEFRDGGGSLKPLHRLIVTSATYRQSAASVPEFAAIDSGNQSLWRQNRRKLEAEAVRDAVLAVAGTLDLTMGGPGWQDFKIEHPAHSPHYRYDLADPEDKATWRRGIYRFIVRSQTQPFMTVLDCADPSMRVEKRNQSISALQALALLNNGFMTTQARHFAARVEREIGGDPVSQVDHAIRLALGRPATAEERTALVSLTEAHGLANTCRAILNLNEFSFVD